MIQKFVDRFMGKEDWVKEQFSKHPTEYMDIVRVVVEAVSSGDDYGTPDLDRIQEIDWGDYQGTLFYVIGADGYQPSDFWCVTVGYGSCSGCDTLQAIHKYSDNPPTAEQVRDYWTLALHIVQGLVHIGG